MVKKFFSYLTVFVFTTVCISQNFVFAQSFKLPEIGTKFMLTNYFDPIVLSGMILDPENPMAFEFYLDRGDVNDISDQDFRAETQKIINYFFTTLTVPDEEMWVNLSPYENDRIIADGLDQTEMGRDMLIQDYLLKQLSASLMYPEDQLGKNFWEKVYTKAKKEYGTINIPTKTFNKVWIVPDKASVYIKDTSVFVAETHLKVMLEEDYLAKELSISKERGGKKNLERGLFQTEIGRMQDVALESSNNVRDDKQRSPVVKEVLREIIIPAIEQEVNEGKTFANLRQIYSSMLLATWYKRNLKKSYLGKLYFDRNAVKGIQVPSLNASVVSDNKQSVELSELSQSIIEQKPEYVRKIYNQYVESFKVGVYDFIREEYDPQSQTIIPKKYFSGGLQDFASLSVKNNENSISPDRIDDKIKVVVEPLNLKGYDSDSAQIGEIREIPLVRAIKLQKLVEAYLMKLNKDLKYPVGGPSLDNSWTYAKTLFDKDGGIVFTRYGDIFFIDSTYSKHLPDKIKNEFGGNMIVIPHMKKTLLGKKIGSNYVSYTMATFFQLRNLRKSLDSVDNKIVVEFGSGEGFLSVLIKRLGFQKIVMLEKFSEKYKKYNHFLFKVNGFSFENDVVFRQADFLEKEKTASVIKRVYDNYSDPYEKEDIIGVVNIGSWPDLYGKTTNRSALDILHSLEYDFFHTSHLVLGGYPSWGLVEDDRLENSIFINYDFWEVYDRESYFSAGFFKVGSAYLFSLTESELIYNLTSDFKSYHRDEEVWWDSAMLKDENIQESRMMIKKRPEEKIEDSGNSAAYGGIDFNANDFEIKESGDEAMIFNFSEAQIDSIQLLNFQGLRPVIQSIVPVNYSQLLTEHGQEKETDFHFDFLTRYEVIIKKLGKVYIAIS